MKSNYKHPGSFFSAPVPRREPAQNSVVAEIEFQHRLQKYVHEVKRMVHKNWAKPEVDREIRVVAGCRLHREGYISEIKLFYSCGIRSIDFSALKAIEKTIPFPNIPVGLPEFLDIQFEFEQGLNTQDSDEIIRKGTGAPPPRVKRTSVPTLRLPTIERD
jgi:hypothetical protein